MAKKGDYFGLPYIVSVILAIIPVTAWVSGWITRPYSLDFGFTIVWIIDLILMIVSKHIMRLLPV